MKRVDIMNILDTIIREAKTAIIATVDKKGKPSMRWVTPVLIKGRDIAVYMVTSPNSEKVKQVRENPHVQWMFQTRALDTIILLEGRADIVDNPSLVSEVLEAVGPSIRAFWKINENETDLLVLETIIESATEYRPMKGTKRQLVFK